MRGTYLIVLLALLVAACTQAPAEAPTAAGDAPQETADDAAPAMKDDAGSGSALDELKGLLAKQIEYQVTYDMVTDANGEKVTGVMSQYIKGTGKMRVDFSGSGQSTRTYMIDKTYTTCMDQSGWTCFQIDVPEDDSFNPQEFREEVEADDTKYTTTALPSRTIAGASASCFRVTSEDGTVDYCLSKDGVPLYIKSSGTSDGVTYSSELTATAYSKSVAESAFTLPAEPKDMAALTGGYDPEAYADLAAQYGG